MDDPNSLRILHLKYNFAYITLILLAILLAVIAHKWTPQPRFTEYLSNAATLASLLLALVAIVYSFISSESISKSLGQISLISRDVRASRDEVHEFIETAKEINLQVEEGVDQFQRASEQVSGELVNLNSTILSLDSHTRSLQDTVTEIPARLSQIEDRFGGLEKAVNKKHSHLEGQPPSPAQASIASLFSDDLVDAFLEKSSLYENLLAVAIVLAYNTENPLSVEDFCSAAKASIRNKAEGFISCMNAVGLASLSKTDSPRVYNVDHVNETLINKAHKYFEDYLEYVKHIDPKQYFDFKDKLASVNFLFQSISQA
jgi:hypothetical protein